MKSSAHFFTAIRNDVIGLALFVILWGILAIFFPPYILPSPVAVLAETSLYLNYDFLHHLAVTLYRVLAGFAWAFGLGSLLGMAAYSFGLTIPHNSFMSAVQVMPGTIIGIIFLLMFGIGHQTPIALVAFLTLPTIAINTANTLGKKNTSLEHYLISARGRRSHLVRYLYLPALVPTIQSNLTIGLGLALKVVILGEFIGSQDGLGYLLNVARVYFRMKEVFFYLFVILLVTVVFQIAQNSLFTTKWLKKYFYPD
jgi:NitT/TauT family transport system permease protein